MALFWIALGLSMDAFAAAVCKGMAVPGIKWRQAATIGGWFGLFQAGMPLLGYALGSGLSARIVRYDHWIALILLSYLGVNMILEAGKTAEADAALNARGLLPLALATSVDAMAAGVTFAFLQEDVIRAAALIGLCTFTLSFIGALLGRMLGQRWQRAAAYLGGGMLILMGIRIFLEHLGIL